MTIKTITVGGTTHDINAAQLITARTIRTNLASTSTASFDGSANITPGVTGTLAIGNGGTGTTTGHIAITQFNNSTSSASPGSGGSFTCVDSITTDSYGHVTKINVKTVTLPTYSGGDVNGGDTPANVLITVNNNSGEASFDITCVNSTLAAQVHAALQENMGTIYGEAANDFSAATLTNGVEINIYPNDGNYYMARGNDVTCYITSISKGDAVYLRSQNNDIYYGESS